MSRKRNKGWASALDGFSQGYGMSKRWQEDRAVDEVMKAKPEDTTQFTQGDSEQLRAISEARDADGNLAYQVTPNEQGGYGLKVRGQDGGYAPVEGQQFQPRQQQSFLGKTYEQGQLTPETMDNARYGALADVKARFNPAEGLRMRRENRQMARQEKQDARADVLAEREDTKWNRENDALAREEQRRKAGMDWFNQRLVNTDGSQRQAGPEDITAFRTYRAGQYLADGDMDGYIKETDAYSQAAVRQIQMQNAERQQAIGPAVAAMASGNFEGVRNFFNKYSTDGSQVTSIANDPKGGIVVQRASVDGAPLPPHTFKNVEELAAGVLSTYDPKAFMDWNNTQWSRNMEQRRMVMEQERLNLQRQQVGISARNADRRDFENFYDPATGQIVAVDMNRVTVGQDGRAQLPAGLQPMPRQAAAPNPQARATIAAKYRELNPEWSAERALMQADEDLAAASLRGLPRPTSGGGGDTDLQKLNAERGGAKPKPAPASAAPARQIGTIVPPRSAADMRQRTPEEIARQRQLEEEQTLLRLGAISQR
jgi:hypothetical protein